MDRLLRLLVRRSMRRGLAGEPLWLAVAGAAWLVHRTLSRPVEPAWSGRLRPGQRLVVDVVDARHPPAAGGE
ncbi:MAG TPA: hypothetical protein VEG62_09335 [Acidimicrobiales bacterium]|nr:hypothetical protein [Acidimicrobiales bacterium]